MTLADIVAVAMFVGIIAYALFAGADFGSGFYDLTAGGGVRGAEMRTLVDHSIGPVWEANHVWLIYVLVIWWTGFPAAFAAAMTTPFILGTVAGAIASGRIPAGGYGDMIGSWFNPTSLVGGCLAVTTCIFL